MSDDDYIELNNPKEVIREGDQFRDLILDGVWIDCHASIGRNIGDWIASGFKIRRPRSTVIRDAAIDFMRAVHERPLRVSAPYHWPEAAVLLTALGLTIEELRGAHDRK